MSPGVGSRGGGCWAFSEGPSRRSNKSKSFEAWREGRRVRAGYGSRTMLFPQGSPGPLTWVSVGTGAASESWAASLLSFAFSLT